MAPPRRPTDQLQAAGQQVEQRQEGAQVNVTVGGDGAPQKSASSAGANNANLWRMLFLTIGVIVGGGLTAGGVRALGSSAVPQPMSTPPASYHELVRSVDSHLTSVDARLTSLEKGNAEKELARARWEQSVDDKLNRLVDAANRSGRHR